jgi:hypothetical protein
MSGSWGISHGTWQIISIILLGLLIWYIVTNYISLGMLIKEGFTLNTTPTTDDTDSSTNTNNNSTTKTSVGASSEMKESDTRTTAEDWKNRVALDKYRGFYDNILVNTHDSLGYLAVQQIVDMPTIEQSSPAFIQYLQNLNTICDAHRNVSQILGWMDKQ